MTNGLLQPIWNDVLLNRMIFFWNNHHIFIVNKALSPYITRNIQENVETGFFYYPEPSKCSNSDLK